ncbi:MAG: hypothetical protein GF334_06435 [Candidatus Altiarchaeales archaeon]|nr:hypothetical protein [Candidatus Altiarchaeales archaeon]
MAQDPIQVDAIQIAPLTSGYRIIDYDSTSGSIRIQDPSLSSATKLVALAGLRSVDNVIIVGKDGPGVTYNTIQEAYDAVPSSSSLTDPWTILVFPGVYQENVVIEKNAVSLIGLGGVIVTPSSADATILFQEAVGSTPEYARIQNIRIENSNDGEECVKILGSSGTTLGESGIFLDNCEMVASGIGTYQLYAEVSNDIYLTGGTFSGSSSTSLVHVQQCHKFFWSGVEGANLGQIDYNSAGVIPSQFGSTYTLRGLSTGSLQSNLSGGGSLEISNCSTGAITFLGDQSASIRGSVVGALGINNTFEVTLIGSSRGSASGTGVLIEEIVRGSVSFAASTLESVTLPVATVDSDYGVSLDYEMASLANVKSKTSTGFIVEFSGAQTGTVYWTVLRRV